MAPKPLSGFASEPAEDAETAAVEAPASPWRPLPAYLDGVQGGVTARLFAFNRFPTRYAHPSWWPGSWNRDLIACVHDERTEARVGEELMRRWGLDTRPCFDMNSFPRRLALLDPEALNRLVLLVGLARHAGEISRIMERSRVKELRNQVGEDAYKFAMLRAPLFAGTLSSGIPLRHSQDSNMRHRAFASGLDMLAACLSGSSEGLRARVALKFHRGHRRFLARSVDSRPIEPLARLFRKILNQEVHTKWDSLLSQEM